MKNRKFIVIILFVIIMVLVPVITPIIGRNCDFSVEKACKFVTDNAEVRSKTWCAWYVMRAIHAGGIPVYLLPAHSYSWLLPQFGFEEVSNIEYTPRKGDIVVFPAVKGHFWGHIQMWNGKQWVSDFKQKGFYAAKGYMGCEYSIFRKQALSARD